MINFKKLIAVFLTGCTLTQGSGMLCAYAFPDLVKPGESVSRSEIFLRSSEYLGKFSNTTDMARTFAKWRTNCRYERIKSQSDDQYVTGSIAAIFSAHGEKAPSSGIELPDVVNTITSQLDKVELSTTVAVVAYAVILNSFKVLYHLKHCGDVLPREQVNTVKAGCINNYLIAIACLFRGGYTRLARLLYSVFPTGYPDEERLIFDDVRVVNPFDDNKVVGTGMITKPTALLGALYQLNDQYERFYDYFYATVLVGESVLSKISDMEAENKIMQQKAVEEMRARQKEEAKARRAAEREEQEKVRLKEEEAKRKEEQERARLKEAEEDKRRADEIARRKAEEEAELEKERKLLEEVPTLQSIRDANSSEAASRANRPNHGKKRPNHKKPKGKK